MVFDDYIFFIRATDHEVVIILIVFDLSKRVSGKKTSSCLQVGRTQRLRRFRLYENYGLDLLLGHFIYS